MVPDAIAVMLDFDKTTFSVQFIDCFDDLKGSDANFEMVASNTLQPVRLIYSHNIATSKIAVIFSSSKLFNSKEVYATERAEVQRQIFKDILEFDEVTVHNDPSKADMIKELNALKKRSDEFEKTRGDKDVLAIAVINIGYFLDLETDLTHVNISKKAGWKAVA